MLHTAFMLTVLGTPQLYTGEEIAMEGKINVTAATIGLRDRAQLLPVIGNAELVQVPVPVWNGQTMLAIPPNSAIAYAVSGVVGVGADE